MSKYIYELKNKKYIYFYIKNIYLYGVSREGNQNRQKIEAFE